MEFDALKAPFDPKRISWRIGHVSGDKTKAQALAYIDARDVYERLDQVAGPENWQCRYSHADKKTVCEIGIRIGDSWVWKANGAGDSDIEAEKGALSDALKRAAVVWGIGRYLYDLDSPWVAVEPAGKSYRIKKEEYARLEGILRGKSPAKQVTAVKHPAEIAGEWLNSFAIMVDGLNNADENHKYIRDNIDYLRRAGGYPQHASKVADYLAVIGESL